jgi:uncharacterized protein (TIGR02145 family)
VVNTVQYDNVTYYSALLSGELVSSESNILSRGFYLSTSPDFNLNVQVITSGVSFGSFSDQSISLDDSTTYFFRAYAESSVGTALGSVMSFTTYAAPVINFSPGSGVIVGGQNYSTIILGNGQEWMSENLAYAFGTYYPYSYNNANVALYGYLYDYQTAANVCPVGWHLPTFEDYSNLVIYLDPFAFLEPVALNSAGGKMKTSGNIFWVDPNTGASNESGFNGLPGGYGYEIFGWSWGGMNTIGVWWLSDNNPFSLAANSNAVTLVDFLGTPAICSVRCIKD